MVAILGHHPRVGSSGLFVLGSLDTSSSAIFFTTSMGTCSKCVWDFRVALFDLGIDEQYRDARHTGDLFWKPGRFLSLG